MLVGDCESLPRRESRTKERERRQKELERGGRGDVREEMKGKKRCHTLSNDVVDHSQRLSKRPQCAFRANTRVLWAFKKEQYKKRSREKKRRRKKRGNKRYKEDLGDLHIASSQHHFVQRKHLPLVSLLVYIPTLHQRFF